MNIKKLLPYLSAIVVFIIASLLYFNPVLSGKQIKQSDITQFSGMSKEIVDYREANQQKEPYWLGNAFSGMPAYQVSAYFPNDFMRYIDKMFRFLPRPADYLFLYFLGFFILLTALKVDWRLAVLGALSFGFSTYLIIIFGAGHNAKAHAIAYMPMVVAGFLFVFQKRYLLGFIVTSLAMALEVYANHPQMTYYLGFCLLILGIIELIEAIKQRQIPSFIKQVAVLVVAVSIGVGVNATRLLSMKEYAKFSNRGKSELTVNPNGTQKEKSSGLDKDYITKYSYGKLETFNLLVPRFMGGGTLEKLGESSDFYQILEQNVGKKVAKEYSDQALTYWGTQPIVEAPAYIGAVIFFLFFLGIFLVKGKLKKWLVAATIFSIVMSWGKNLSLLTNFFIDFVPLYNKFRAVSSIQVIAELCVPILGVLGLKTLLSTETSLETKKEGFKKSLIVVLSLIVVGLLFAFASSTFEGLRDANYQELPELIEALIAERKSMLLADSFRSIILILLAAGFIFLYLQKKLKQVPVIIGIAALILFDLVSVNIRYVNNEDFTIARNIKKPFTPSQADEQILQDKSHYRVANLTVNFLNEARTSYFHHSIGGYHAAKMKRYQELFDYQFGAKKKNPEILNMLNAKYIIAGADMVQINPDANGNAWFVNEIKIANNADQEMKLLGEINTKKTAVINKSQGFEQTIFEKDSTATIELKKYDVNQLVYESNSNKNQFAVFSEIYYKNGWNAYIDGELKPHYQIDYVLRGMQIPSGKHTIEFKFEPKVISIGSTFSLISYALLLFIPLGWFFFEKKKNEKA